MGSNATQLNVNQFIPMLQYLVQYLQYNPNAIAGLGTNANHTGSPQNEVRAFDNSKNSGWGANAYVDSIFTPSDSLKYAKSIEKDSAPAIKGDDDKNLSIESALSYSEMGLMTIDGKCGNGNGTVTLSEFKIGSGASQALAKSIDINGDGNIDRSELTAYNMLADELDGNLDGKIKQEGFKEIEDLINGDDEDKASLKTKLTGYQEKIKEQNDAFGLEFETIDGTNEDGSYEGDSVISKGANAGEATRKAFGTKQELFTNMQFMYGTEDKDKKDSGIAFATALLGGQKKIAASACTLNVPDLDSDGYISADEVLASLMYQDKNNDGILDYKEKLAFGKLCEDGDADASKVKEIWEDKELEDARMDLEMPDIKESAATAVSGNDPMSLLVAFFKSLGIQIQT